MITKADSELQQEVNDGLRFNPSVGGAELSVAAREGVITLSGQTDTYAQKYAAIRGAARVHGVRAVADDITVILPFSTKRTDADIARGVVALLKWNVKIPDDRIRARVQDGWVTLEGDVEWQFQKAAAERLIRALSGARGLTSTIVVKNNASATDERHRIDSAAWSAPGVIQVKDELLVGV